MTKRAATADRRLNHLDLHLLYCEIFLLLPACVVAVRVVDPVHQIKFFLGYGFHSQPFILTLFHKQSQWG